MKTLTEIRQELSTVIKQCEEYRLEKLAKYRQGVVISSISGVITLMTFLISFYSSIPILFHILSGIFVLISIVIYTKTVSGQSNSYKLHFKSNVLKNVVESLMPTVSYNAERSIDRSDFNNANLFSTNYNEYKGEDYFKGIHNGISFEMSELNVIKRTTTRTNGRSSTSTTVIFNGIFIIISSKKATQGETYVIPDTAEKIFGSFGKFIQKSLGSMVRRGSMIYLEQFPDFEKKFVVYSTEEIESQRLLTENMIESILDIHTRWRILPSLAFIQNKVYIAIPYAEDFLEVSLHKSILENEEQFLDRFVDEIALSLSVIDELSDELA